MFIKKWKMITFKNVFYKSVVNNLKGSDPFNSVNNLLTLYIIIDSLFIIDSRE